MRIYHSTGYSASLGALTVCTMKIGCFICYVLTVHVMKVVCLFVVVGWLVSWFVCWLFSALLGYYCRDHYGIPITIATVMCYDHNYKYHHYRHGRRCFCIIRACYLLSQTIYIDIAIVRWVEDIAMLTTPHYTRLWQMSQLKGNIIYKPRTDTVSTSTQTDTLWLQSLNLLRYWHRLVDILTVFPL